MKIKFKDIPLDFVCENRYKVEDELDRMTSLFCFCGRLATGLHTRTCRKYISKFQNKILELYKDNVK